MKSFWNKFNKTCLTLLLMLGVFFAGFVGFVPTKQADAVFQDTQVSNEVYYENTAMYVTYAGDTLFGVDDNGYIYKANEGTASLKKTGVVTGKITPFYGYLYNSASYTPSSNYIAYKNGTLVIASYDGTNTNMYYSTDAGTTWVANNLGSIGKPVSLFACMMSQGSGSYILSSTDGKTWTTASEFSVYPDVHFAYNNGYFIKVDAYSVDHGTTNTFVCISLDLKNWTQIATPQQSTSSNGFLKYNGTSAFVVGSALYVIQGYDTFTLYKTTTFESNATWQTLDENITFSYNAVPYQNGVILGQKDNSVYYEISDEGFVNGKTLISNDAMSFISETIPYAATTVAYNDQNLCVGFSGSYYYSEQGSDSHIAMFSTYARPMTYKVDFVDWNGNIITSVDVVKGDIANAPVNPTREGYTFAGWDYDITQPITEDTTITAQYTRNNCNVLFLDYNGQTIASLSVPYGEQISEEDIPTPSNRVGYQFMGWNGDTKQAVISDLTFVAEYSEQATLTVKYPIITGTFGLENQFHKTGTATKTFTYLVGDTIKNNTFNTWYERTITPWLNDFDDGYYDYDVAFAGWNIELPTVINQDITLIAETEKLIKVRLEYYSQLRFNAYTYEGVDYYFTFVGNMKIERLIQAYTVLDIEHFKDPEVDYEIYNAGKNEFYNNLEHFEFLGWNYDISQPVTEDVDIIGSYNMPTINVKMFDLDGYLFNEVDQPISFMTIEDFQAMSGSGEIWSRIEEGIRLFFSFQWGELGDTIADMVDFTDYIGNVRQYHKKSRQILTGYAVINTNNPEIYGGVFKYGAVRPSSEVLQYYAGTARENNMSYWINPIVFSTTAFSLTCTVDYDTALGSAIKTVSKIGDILSGVFDWLWNFIQNYWWVIVLVALAIIFRKPLIAGLSVLFGWIGNGTKKLANKIKSKSKNSTYKKTEKEYSAVKKQSKKKE